MKKLLVLISALAAFSFGSAKADVTVSGASDVQVQSIGSATNIRIGGSVGFGLSTTLDNGVTVTSSGMSLGIATDGAADADINDADAFHQLTFAAGGTSLTVGGDLEVDYADLGVGGVAGDNVSVGLGTATSALTLGETTGMGFALSTAMGGASVTIGHVFDNDEQDNVVDINESGHESSSAMSLSLPVGPLSATIGYQIDNSNSAKVTTTGANVAYAMPQGTVKLGYVSADGSADGTAMSVAYSTSLGDGTAVAVGYTTTDVDSLATTTDLEVAVSRSIGAGASVFVELHNRNGVAASGETSAVALGTSIAF
jgi:invasion protein IalB